MVEQKYIDYWRDRQNREIAESQAQVKQAWLDVERVAKDHKLNKTEYFVF